MRISAPGMAGSLQLLREARHRVAAAVPDVEVLVERRYHDLEVAVLVQVSERGRGGEAALDVVVARAVHGAREQGIEPHREARHDRAVGLPGVDVLAGGVHDLGLHVAVDVADRGRAQHLARRIHRAVGLRGRVHVRVQARAHRLPVVEARQRRAVGVHHPQLAARVGQHRVERVVAVEVEQARRGLAAGAEVLRPALVQRRVAVGEQHLAVLGAVARGVGDHDAHGERGLVRVLVAGPRAPARSDPRWSRRSAASRGGHAQRPGRSRRPSRRARTSPSARSPLGSPPRPARCRAPTGAGTCSPPRGRPTRGRRSPRSPAG